MFRSAGAVLQAFQVVRIISSFPAVERLGRDAEVAAGKASIVIMGIIVIKPFEPLPGWLRQHRDARQAPRTRYYTAIDTHSAAIITSSHDTSSVTHLSERDQSIPIVEQHTKSMKFEDNLGYRAKHP